MTGGEPKVGDGNLDHWRLELVPAVHKSSENILVKGENCHQQATKSV